MLFVVKNPEEISAVGRATGKKRQSGPSVHMMNADGTRANSALEDRQVIMEYFSKVFKAAMTTFTHAVSRDRTARPVETFEKDLPDIDGAVTPNCYNSACGFAHKTKTKAHGEHLRDGVFDSAYPNEMGKYIYR